MEDGTALTRMVIESLLGKDFFYLSREDQRLVGFLTKENYICVSEDKKIVFHPLCPEKIKYVNHKEK